MCKPKHSYVSSTNLYGTWRGASGACGELRLFNSHNGKGINPRKSADTRRRINKLSKARECEKAPCLGEYFCVASSVSSGHC